MKFSCLVWNSLGPSAVALMILGCGGSDESPNSVASAGKAGAPSAVDTGALSSGSMGGAGGTRNPGDGSGGRNGSGTAAVGGGGQGAELAGTSGSGTGGTADGGMSGSQGGFAGAPPPPVTGMPVRGSSTLPTPAGPADAPKPTKSGTNPNLKVLPWAGFKAAVSYTLDDSQPSQIDHFADLRATGVPLTFYITTQFKYYAGYAATWKEAWAEGDELGNHTVNHCYYDLTGCTAHLPTVDAEIDDCSAYIKTTLGPSEVWTMAYPFGDAAYKPAAQARFFLARGTSDGMVGPGDNTDAFNLPVKAASGGESAATFNAWVDGARTQGKWAIFLLHSLLPNAQNWYAGVDTANLVENIGHDKSVGDVWIGTVANIGAYWLGQKLVQAKASSASSGAVTLTWSMPPHFPPGTAVRVTVDGGTLSQQGKELPWNGHGYYEVALDPGSLSWTP